MALLDCFGRLVGFPHDQMGNYEVGHIHYVPQDFFRINDAIEDEIFLRIQFNVIRSILQKLMKMFYISGGCYQQKECLVTESRLWRISAIQIKECLLEAITSGKYEAIICNFFNSGKVGHSGIIKAAIRAVEAVDRVLQGIVEALKSVGRRILLNADRGDFKQMVDKETEQPLTAHTKNPLSWVYVCGDKIWSPSGGLSDLATAVRAIFGIELLPEMSGRTLFNAD